MFNTKIVHTYLFSLLYDIENASQFEWFGQLFFSQSIHWDRPRCKYIMVVWRERDPALFYVSIATIEPFPYSTIHVLVLIEIAKKEVMACDKFQIGPRTWAISSRNISRGLLNLYWPMNISQLKRCTYILGINLKYFATFAKSCSWNDPRNIWN